MRICGGLVRQIFFLFIQLTGSWTTGILGSGILFVLCGKC